MLFELMFDKIGAMGFVSAAAAEERISAALDAIDAAHDVLRDTSSDLVGNDFRVKVAERLENQDRVNRGLMYRFFGEIAEPPDGAGFLSAVRDMLWARLRITPKEITRRFRLAARIRPRRSLTGPPLPPELPELADAVQAGAVGEDHIRAVCRAVDVLPASVAPNDVANAERHLVEHATKLDAGVVTKLGQRIADRAAAHCGWAHSKSMACPGWRDCSTLKPARTSRPLKPRCDPAATSPIARTKSPMRVIRAHPPSAAMTR
jgi:hypothetical protein